MMKPSPSISKLLLLLFSGILLTAGCVKEPCLDLEKLDRYSAQTREWFVDDTIGNRTIVDEHGITQTLAVSSRDSAYFEHTVEDDCGNTYGSFDFSIQYNTSLAPLFFMVVIHGSGLEEDGFTLEMTTLNINNEEHKSTVFDFVKNACRDNNAVGNYLDELTVGNCVYHGVLEIIYNSTFSPEDIRTVYYAKGYGIIKFTTANGDSFGIAGP